MTNQMIPAEAVEAAIAAWSKIETRTLHGRMYEALEAAAPHMLAAAWDEGHKLGQSAPCCPEPNPHRTPDAR